PDARPTTRTTSFCRRRPASAPRTPTCLGTRCPPQSSSLPCPRQTRACCSLARSRRGTRAPLPPPPPDVPAPRASRPLRLRVAEPRDPSTRLRSGKRMPREDSWLLRWRFTTRRFSMPRKNALTRSLLLFVAVAILLLRSEEHTSELQSRVDLVCRLLLEKKNNNT